MVIRLILIFEFQLPNSNPSKNEVECKAKLSYHERDIQKIGDINYLTRLNIVCFPKQINVSYTKFNLVTDLQIMLSNVTDSSNTERGFKYQLYIALGLKVNKICHH